MKKPEQVGTIVEGQIYTVPTYTNLYATKVSGNNATIKMYTPRVSIANHGIMPISLVKVLLMHYAEEGNPNQEEKLALEHLEKAYKILKLNG